MSSETVIHKLFAGPCDFVAGADTPVRLPPATVPEFAFAGRSNAGKSSLLNALVNRKSLARTSSNPGHTRQVNFFDLGGTLLLVDMPGYGFAKAPKTMRAEWEALIRAYLRGRQTLRTVFLLADGRIGLKDEDEDTLKLLDGSGVGCRIVFTKGDKIKPAERAAIVESVAPRLKRHPSAHPTPLFTSSITGEGMDDLRRLMVESIGLVPFKD